MRTFTDILQRAVSGREKAALCTLVDTSGSTPLKPGAKMLVWHDGRITGTVGGGQVEKQVVTDALQALEARRPGLWEYALSEQDMCCGGTMRVFIEPLVPRKRLVIFGAGHIGSHIAWYAQKLDFETIVVDERGEFLENTEWGHAKTICCPYREAIGQIGFDDRTYIVVCTHRHDYDRGILAACIALPHAYLGMIGSRRKVLVTAKRFRTEGIASSEALGRVDMPMGFPLGGNSPAEIALGIVARIVAVSNGVAVGQDETDEQLHGSHALQPESHGQEG